MQVNFLNGEGVVEPVLLGPVYPRVRQVGEVPDEADFSPDMAGTSVAPAGLRLNPSVSVVQDALDLKISVRIYHVVTAPRFADTDNLAGRAYH